MTSRSNTLDQALDIAGSLTQTAGMTLVNEPSFLGTLIQSGAGAVVVAGSPVTVTGLVGMTTSSEGNFLTISGSGLGNDGNYLILNYLSANSVQIEAPLIVNEGGLGWVERAPYSLEDDLNFVRTDRAAIKGTDYWDPIPTYYRCSNQLVPVPANLTNISGKTTDAKSLVTNRKYYNAVVNVGDTFITLISLAGELKHADAVNVIGVPINDGFDAGNDCATYAEIVDGYGVEFSVLTGVYAGYRIFGRTRGGASVSPNAVEVEFRAVQHNDPISVSVPYTWEAGQGGLVNVYYGYRDCLDTMDECILRTTLVDGLVGGGGGISLPEPTGIGQVLFATEANQFHVVMPVTSQEGWLVNEDGILIVNLVD